jgi:hypothetical protein
MNDVLFNQWSTLADATLMTVLLLAVEMLQILARIWN